MTILAYLLAAGLLLVAVGVGLIFVPAGVIVAGVELVAVAAWLDLLQPDESAET